MCGLEHGLARAVFRETGNHLLAHLRPTTLRWLHLLLSCRSSSRRPRRATPSSMRTPYTYLLGTLWSPPPARLSSGSRWPLQRTRRLSRSRRLSSRSCTRSAFAARYPRYPLIWLRLAASTLSQCGFKPRAGAGCCPSSVPRAWRPRASCTTTSPSSMSSSATLSCRTRTQCSLPLTTGMLRRRLPRRARLLRRPLRARASIRSPFWARRPSPVSRLPRARVPVRPLGPRSRCWPAPSGRLAGTPRVSRRVPLLFSSLPSFAARAPPQTPCWPPSCPKF